MFNPYYRGPLYSNNNINPLLRRNVISRSSTRNITQSFIPRISKIIETTQRGINTYNQIVPIYKEVKPIISKIGETGKKFYSFFNKNMTRNASIKDDNIVYEEYHYESPKMNDRPSSPFFSQK